jgi:hypothetical protein
LKTIFYDGEQFLEVGTTNIVVPKHGDLFRLDKSFVSATCNPVSMLDKMGFWLQATVGKPIYEYAKLISKTARSVPENKSYRKPEKAHIKYNKNVQSTKGRTNSKKEKEEYYV